MVIRPPDIETSSAGMAVTRPSPTVRMVKVWAASDERHAALHHADDQAGDDVDAR